jgi:tetratricopeptide (TPR) repeat protein
MSEPTILAWDFYLQGYRLHPRMTKQANFEACTMFRMATGHCGDFARAWGHHSFSRQLAVLNRWLDPEEAKQRLDEVIADVKALEPDGSDPIFSMIIQEVNDLKGDEDILDIFPKIVILFYAAKAVQLDPSDYDNVWSWASALIYNKHFDEGLAQYQVAIDLAENQDPPPPEVNVASLHVDRADALFFTARGDVEEEGEARIREAIEETESAIKRVPLDPKRSYWNWTLGWAYYELGFFGHGPACYAQSLALLQQFRNPIDLILKNIMANYAALGEMESAQRLAADFLSRNPDYDLSLEDRWPYRDVARRQSWKTHLSLAGLPGNPD